MSEPVKLFPILVPGDVLARASVGELDNAKTTTIVCAIPWAMIGPHELRVRRLHRKSLSFMVTRGGLDATEAVLAIEGQLLSWSEANARLSKLVAEHGMAKAA